jgi:hypothetical protein
VRSFKGIICDNISEFESSHPSHAVGLLQVRSPAIGTNVRSALGFHHVVLVHADAEAHAQHAFFAWCDGSEHAGGGLAQVRLDGGVDRQDRVLVLDEIPEMGILLVADGGLERQRLLGDLELIFRTPL